MNIKEASTPMCLAGSLEKPGCAAERFKARIAELERALSARPEVARIPEGWKMVPLEPTLEMKEAAAMYRASCEETRLQKTFGGYYRAMLAAAPSVPSPLARRPEEKS